VFTAGEAKQARRLAIVVAIVAVFFVFQFWASIVAKSVSLQADAIHLLMDVFALGMSLLVMRIAVRRPTPRFTFGLRRVEPIAAIFNAVLVLSATVEIVREGVERLSGNEPPRSWFFLLFASVAVVINGVNAWLLHDAIHHGHDEHGHGKKHGHALNLRGAWLHLIGDTLGSMAALAAAVVIRCGGPASADPIAGFLVAAILVVGAFNLIREAVLVLLEAAPVHVPVDAVREVIREFPGVAELCELHVWTLGAGHDAITARVRGRAPDPALAASLGERLRAAFGAEYVTVQVDARSE
jgi:cobalt-zinc-cadmium efflux system protein